MEPDDDYGGSPTDDVFAPTEREIREWSASGALAPTQDWDLGMAHLEFVDLLLELIQDEHTAFPGALLASLYCVVGHSDRSDARLSRAVEAAGRAEHPWLTTWARRVRAVWTNPSSFNRLDWCGQGFSMTPVD
jgi:hypothetical protein